MADLSRTGGAARARTTTRRSPLVTTLGIAGILAIALAGVLGTARAASNEGIGAFAIRGGSARGAVLGEAYGAIGGDADAIVWNPAGLAMVSRTELQATYQDVFGLGLARHTSVSVAVHPVTEELVTRGDSLAVVTSHAPGPVYGVAVGVLVVDLDEESYWEFTPTVGIAHRLASGTAVGAAARYLRASSTLDGVSATGYALDVGVIQSLPRDAAFGVSLRNVLGRVSWKEGREEGEPRELIVSAAVPATSRAVLLCGAATDLDRDLADRWNAAAELHAWPERWTLLVGAESRRDGDEMRARLAAGTRLRVGQVRFDYAFVDAGHTPGDTHRATLAVVF
jgi:hypothetical protein